MNNNDKKYLKHKMMSEGMSRYVEMLEAIESERQEEENYFNKLSADKGVKHKINAGIYWQNATVNSKYYAVGEFIEIELERNKNLAVSHKFKIGVGVKLIFTNDEMEEYKGTVSWARRNILKVILNSETVSLNQIPSTHLCNIEIVFDPKPYRVMRNSLEKLITSKEDHVVELREAIRDKKINPVQHQLLNLKHYQNNKNLNPSQNEAVVGVVNAPLIGIIHGPPGTGKTTTLIELIKLLIKSEKQVLVCAPSNNAVDLLAYRLSKYEVNVLRIGNITRVGDKITHLTLSEKARDHEEWQHIKKVRIEADKARKMALKYKRSFGHQEKQDRKSLLIESKELKKWARDLEDKLMDTLIGQAQVICTTLIGSDTELLKDRRFKTVVIDEASQALEAECWTAMIKAERVILAGDHLQLPPTVKSQKARDLDFDKTILDRMKGIETSFLLKEQYRMNDKILSFSNFKFYNNQLISNPTVANHSLENDTAIASFIDTSGCGFDENFNPEFRSYFNEGEYFILREHFEQNKEKYQNQTIGIIAPYAEQVRFLRTQIANQEVFADHDIEVDSIDGFQGQEKDIIYLSLVRSNDQSNIGFLKDERRINVALTRARKKLVVIGDGATLGTQGLFLELIEHFEKHCTYQSAWEYMA